MAKKTWDYAALTQATEKRIVSLMKSLGPGLDLADANRRNWAYGAFLLWEKLTQGWQEDGDKERLEKLTENWRFPPEEDGGR